MAETPTHLSPPKVRFGALLLAAASAVAGLTACSGSTEGSSSCPLVLQFEGHGYAGAAASRDLPGMEKVGMGELPGCSDANDNAAESEQAEVWTLKGVDPTVAVAARLGGELQLFVAQDEADVCGVKYTLCG